MTHPSSLSAVVQALEVVVCSFYYTMNLTIADGNVMLSHGSEQTYDLFG
jgi:hypothetical protein